MYKRQIQEIRKTDPDFSMARVTDNDPKVMDMLTQGKTSGVFQMESAGMTGVCEMCIRDRRRDECARTR